MSTCNQVLVRSREASSSIIFLSAICRFPMWKTHYQRQNCKNLAINTAIKMNICIQTIWKWDTSESVSFTYWARKLLIFCRISASFLLSFSKYFDPLLISYITFCTFCLSTPSIPIEIHFQDFKTWSQTKKNITVFICTKT